jgi:hypothetical protein
MSVIQCVVPLQLLLLHGDTATTNSCTNAISATRHQMVRPVAKLHAHTNTCVALTANAVHAYRHIPISSIYRRVPRRYLAVEVTVDLLLQLELLIVWQLLLLLLLLDLLLW